MNKEDREELKELLGMVIKPIDDLLQEHHRTLFGNGSDGHQGLRLDVDRLKQREIGKEKHFWALYIGVIGVTLRGLWEWLNSRGVHP
jgi:hypothetical protein